MPNVNRIISPFIVSGNPDTLNVPINTAPGATGNAVYAPGDLGASFDANGRTYTVAILDSGATAATSIGAPVTGQVLFWKDKNAGIVTNNTLQCIIPSNPAGSIAGVLRNTPGTLGTYGSLICILTRGNQITVVASTCAAGSVMADNTASTARLVTATGVNLVAGQARAADAGGFVVVDLDIPTLP